MTPVEIRREIDALPDLTAPLPEGEGGAPGELSPLQVISRQGRLILRLSAAAEGLEARYKELAERLKEREAQATADAEGLRRERDAARREAEEARREGRETARQAAEQARRVALEAVRLLDTLDWAEEAATARGDDAMARDIAAARRDARRRLAAAGVTEVPCEGMADGHLHEGLEAVTTDAVPRYHIVRVLRRGWQMGPDVLRRAGVVTAA